jgi:hypothetical protein
MNVYEKTILTLPVLLLNVLAALVTFSNCQGQNQQNTKKMETKQVTNPMSPGTTNPNRVYFITFIYYAEGGEAQLQEFMRQATPLWEKYRLGNVGVIKVGMSRSIEGENTVEQPDEIRLNYAEDMALFEQYTQDPKVQKIDHLRDASFRRLNFILGQEEDIAAFKTYADTPIKDRLYVVQLLHFKEEGQEKFRSFTQQALPLFKQYGLHFDYWLTPMKKIDAKGNGSDLEMPDKVIVFHADDPAQLQPYNANPEYLKLAPVRAEGVAHNKLFGGKLISWGLE